MSFDHWNEFVNPSLQSPTSYALDFLIRAASDSESTAQSVLDKLEVRSIGLNKHPDPPEHEYVIVEVWNVSDQKTLFFIIHRLAQLAPDEGPQLTRRPSRSTLSSMEEGFASANHPVASDLSLRDALSLSAAATSHAALSHLDKAVKMKAVDQILGEDAIGLRRYGVGQNARQVTPSDLKLFDLVVLAEAIHNVAPDYSTLRHNCYWFANALLDAVIELCHTDTLENSLHDHRFKLYQLDPRSSQISGRWKGIRVSCTNQTDLFDILREFSQKHKEAMAKVLFFFSNLSFLTKF
jgi:hypothetical protein